jgi:hypothetical protein
MTEQPRDLADLRSMAAEGMTARQIAPMLGRTIGSRSSDSRSPIASRPVASASQ